MVMIDQALLFAVLVLLMAVLVILYYMLKYNSNFLKQIQSIKGIQLDTLSVGEEAPNFRVMDEKSNRFISKKSFYEKNTLMIFISTKCPTCKAIIDKLDRIDNHYDFNIVLINTDEVNDDTHIKNVLSDNITYIKAPNIATSYFIYVTPTAVLIEKGKIKMINKVNGFNELTNLLINEERKIAG
jgi:thiol-disulfide isomerase/thioredoxin